MDEATSTSPPRPSAATPRAAAAPEASPEPLPEGAIEGSLASPPVAEVKRREAASSDCTQDKLRRREGKQRAVIFSYIGITFGLLVTLAFHLAGFWRLSLEAWGWLMAAASLYHLVLWLIPQLGCDEKLRWDQHYLYLPWACVVAFFIAAVYLLPDARSLMPYGYLVTLLLLVGVAGLREVVAFSLVMWGGYFGAVALLVRQGETLSLSYEASQAGLFLGISLLAGVVLDRTRRDRWESAGLRRRLTLAIRGSGAGWWDLVLDPSQPTVIPDEVHLSAELKALIGFEDHEFPNSLTAWHSRVHGEDIERIRESSRRHLTGASPLRETRYRIRHKNGELRQFYSHSRIQRDSEGLPVRWSGMEWDITDRERDQEEVRKLSRAVEQSSSLVIITDTAGRIEYVNPKFCRTTGYSAEEVLGETPRIFRSGETPGKVYSGMWRALLGGGEWQGEFRNRRKNGELYQVISSISPIKDSAGEITHFLAVQEDVTESRRVEAQLHQAQRMESVGQLVSGVAHDFNNLLTAVIGFADLGLSSARPDDPLAEYLTEIRKAGESAGSLTRQLLAFGRKQILQFEALDLNKAIATVEKLLRRTLGEDVILVTQLTLDLWPVQADPTSIEQLLVNLAVNARDAMPRGGRLTIKTSNLDIGEREARDHPLVVPGAYVLLSMIDTGRGMDDETRARLFEPFFTTKKRGRGTGLGLSTVYGIVKQTSGHISVSSELGRGARFDIYLPRSRQQPRRAAVDIAARELVGGSETILLVEDDERVRELVAGALLRSGHKVLAARDGGEALETARREPFDLLLTDIVMPGMSGLELAAELGRERSGLKVLFMSGYADKEVVGSKITEMGAPFLAKPFRVDQLLHRVRDVLETGTPMR